MGNDTRPAGLFTMTNLTGVSEIRIIRVTESPTFLIGLSRPVIVTFSRGKGLGEVYCIFKLHFGVCQASLKSGVC